MRVCVNVYRETLPPFVCLFILALLSIFLHRLHNLEKTPKTQRNKRRKVDIHTKLLCTHRVCVCTHKFRVYTHRVYVCTQRVCVYTHRVCVCTHLVSLVEPFLSYSTTWVARVPFHFIKKNNISHMLGDTSVCCMETTFDISILSPP